jgi:hypothetical protein
MAFLRDRLSKRGFQVLTVPENATHFLTNSEGFQAEWGGKPAQVHMQRIFLDYQIAQEDAFKAFGELHPTKPSVLLLDCCTLNSKVYLTDEQWSQVLTLPGKPALTEQMLFARYDLVLHLVSCAFEGHYDWGPGSSNPGRYHSPEEAKEHDKRSLNVFANHPQVRVVPHFSDFDSKMEKVLHFLNDALHIDGLSGKRRRQQVRVADSSALSAVVEQATTSSFLVTSTFLDEQMQQSLRRRATIPNQTWLDKFRTTSGRLEDIEVSRDASDVIYERRSHVHMPCPTGGDDSSYLTRRIIKEDDYTTALGIAGSKRTTVKMVLSFVIDSCYYELFFFPNYRDPVLDLSDEIQTLPAWLEAITADPVATTEALPDKTVREQAAVPTPARSMAAPDGTGVKRRRILKGFTTEEAAYGDPAMA